MTTTTTTAVTTTAVTEIRRLLIETLSEPAFERDEAQLYRALRTGLHGFLVEFACPDEHRWMLREARYHLEEHCFRCGAELAAETILAPQLRCCPACIEAGHAAAEPLLEPELPLNAEAREKLASLYYRAVGHMECGDQEGAWNLFEQVSWQVDQKGSRRTLVSTWLHMAELALQKGNRHYARKLWHRCTVVGGYIGDTESVARARERIEQLGTGRPVAVRSAHSGDAS
jgi:hypothetical protein